VVAYDFWKPLEHDAVDVSTASELPAVVVRTVKDSPLRFPAMPVDCNPSSPTDE
jgi:hypothetical protein